MIAVAEDEWVLSRFITWRCPSCAGVFKVDPFPERDVCLLTPMSYQDGCIVCEDFRGCAGGLVSASFELLDVEAQE